MAYSSDLRSRRQPPARPSAEPGAAPTTPGIQHSQLVRRRDPEGPRPTGRCLHLAANSERADGTGIHRLITWSWEHGGFSHKYSLRASWVGHGNSRRGQAPFCPGDGRKPPVSSPQGPGPKDELSAEAVRSVLRSIDARRIPDAGLFRTRDARQRQHWTRETRQRADAGLFRTPDARQSPSAGHFCLREEPGRPPGLSPQESTGPSLQAPACPVPDATGE